MFRRLLAKSSANHDSPAGPETLAGHLVAVTHTAQAMTEEWGAVYLQTLGLDEPRFRDRLRVGVARAAFLHDLGKANDHFQAMVRGGAAGQACWHEQLSIWLILRSEELATWLMEGCDENLRQQVMIAAIGHHLRLEDLAQLDIRSGGGSLTLTMLAGHGDFRRSLEAGAGLLQLGPPPPLSDWDINLLDRRAYQDLMSPWATNAIAWWRDCDQQERRFTALLKALVLSADVAGSIVSRRRTDPATWARNSLSRLCVPAALTNVAEQGSRGHAPRDFQLECGRSASRVTFVRAGCGSGKTAAAYHWAATHAEGRKLFYCYPTTGTATQGFLDYVPGSLAEARLVHSRASVDIEDLLTTGAPDGQDQLDTIVKLGALATWDAPITIATVDTVLGLVQNNRRGLVAIPAIANGAFVFDEIHLYDDRLFGALLRFLEALPGAPMLLMTASLPTNRLEAIQNSLKNAGEDLGIIEGPTDLEEIDRYQIAQVDRGAAWTRIASAIGGGARVLYVCNTVDRAMAATMRAEAEQLPVLAYHSRFRYEDRVARHRAVVSAFSALASEPRLAVTTQVCEVSLDISANLLVTELAPVPALIQRLGRLNRWASPTHPTVPAFSLVIEPEGPAPYDEEDLRLARRWLTQLQGAPVSQQLLRSTLETLMGHPSVTEIPTSAWLDEGLFSSPAPPSGARLLVSSHPVRRCCRTPGHGRPSQSATNHSQYHSYAAGAGLTRDWWLAQGGWRVGGAPGSHTLRPNDWREVGMTGNGPGELCLDLFAPGMTALHRVGLAGLAMTLQAIQANDPESPISDLGEWHIDDRTISLTWKDDPATFFAELFRVSFGLTPQGIIHFPALGDPLSNLADAITHHQAILSTFLQHGQTRKSAGKNSALTVEIDGVAASYPYLPLFSYSHQHPKFNPLRPAAVAGWLYPGGVVRHVLATKETELSEQPAGYLALLYAPVGAVYFQVHRRSRKTLPQYCVVLPEITSLLQYRAIRQALLKQGVAYAHVAGPAEAAFRVLTQLEASGGSLGHLGAAKCEVVAFGTVAWSKQQKTRIDRFAVTRVEERGLTAYRAAAQLFTTQLVRGKPDPKTGVEPTWWQPPRVPDFVAANVSVGHPWWAGFAALWQDIREATPKESRDWALHHEKEGLYQMVSNNEVTPPGPEQIFVRACHAAWRRRSGELGQRARDHGLDFGQLYQREYEHTRISFARCRNASMLRRTLTDFWSRAHAQRDLQDGWVQILPLLGARWEEARDLALLALASYKGQTKDEEQVMASGAEEEAI